MSATSYLLEVNIGETSLEFISMANRIYVQLNWGLGWQISWGLCGCTQAQSGV